LKGALINPISTECIDIEENSTEPIRLPPDGRCIAIQAKEAWISAFTHNISQSVGTVMICDLVEGKTSIATPTTASRISIELDTEFLYTYHLSKNRAIEENTYQLPSLELTKREYLTFLPASCCCTTCGQPIQAECNITVIEDQGVKLIALGHTSMKIGISPLGSGACEPLIFRITSPPVELTVDYSHDARLTVTSARFFPTVLDGENELLPDAFGDSHRACNKDADIECSYHRCTIEYHAAIKTMPVTQMHTWISDFKLTIGEQVLREEVENRFRELEIALRIKNLVGPENPRTMFTIDEARRLIGDDLVPWDSWLEFREAMDEIKDEFDYDAEMKKYYDDDNCGMVARIPLFIQTIFFERGTELQEDFQWSCSSGVGWIEEHVAWLHDRFFGGSFEGSRELYSFPAYEKVVPKWEALISDKGPKGERFKKYFPKAFDVDETTKSERRLTEKEEPKQQASDVKDEDKGIIAFKLRARGPVMYLKDGEFYDPMTKIKDVVESMSDVVPGLGKLFEQRMSRMITSSIMSSLDDDDL
jgi:hypothetical protein